MEVEPTVPWPRTEKENLKVRDSPIMVLEDEPRTSIKDISKVKSLETVPDGCYEHRIPNSKASKNNFIDTNKAKNIDNV